MVRGRRRGVHRRRGGRLIRHRVVQAVARHVQPCVQVRGWQGSRRHARGSGPGAERFLADLKDSQLKTLEAEFARNPYVGPAMVGTRKVRADGTEGASVAAAADGGLPRADISGKITEKLIKEMGDPSWKVRAAALDAVNEILDESAKRIGPNTGDLMPSLAKRFSDANRNIAANARHGWRRRVRDGRTRPARGVTATVSSPRLSNSLVTARRPFGPPRLARWSAEGRAARLSKDSDGQSRVADKMVESRGR